MTDTRFVLLFGPYSTPQFRYGGIVQDEVRGEVEIVGLSDGRIPWPMTSHASTPLAGSASTGEKHLTSFAPPKRSPSRSH